MRRVLLGVLIATLVAPRLTAAADREDLDARARRVSLAFVAGWVVQHPERATQLGEHSEDTRLPDLSVLGLARKREWLIAQRESLLALPLSKLDPRNVVDVRLMLHQAELELRQLAGERRAQRDPGWPLELLRTAASAPLRGGFGSPCGRAEKLARRLYQVPEYLRDAQLNLSAPSRACTELAIEDCSALIEMFRRAPAASFTDCHEPRFLADLAVADSQAVNALSAYRQFLMDDLLPGARDSFPIDSTGLALRLGVGEGLSPPLDSLLARTRIALAHLPAAAPEDSAIVADAEVPPVEAMNAMLDSLRVLMSKNGQFPPLDDQRISVRDRAPLPGTALPEVLAVTGPWEGRAPIARLDLARWPWAGVGALERDPRGDPPALLLLLGREGLPGRGLLALNQNRVESQARQVCIWESTADGWARYAEEQLVQHIRSARRDTLARRHVALERERLARAAAELMLRVEGATLEQTANWLAREAQLPALEAHRAALQAAVTPRFAASALALDQLEQLRARAEHELGPRFRADRFHEAFLVQGTIPVPWMGDDVIRALKTRRKGS